MDAVVNVDLDDSYVLVATYPKTGNNVSGLFRKTVSDWTKKRYKGRVCLRKL